MCAIVAWIGKRDSSLAGAGEQRAFTCHKVKTKRPTGYLLYYGDGYMDRKVDIQVK